MWKYWKWISLFEDKGKKIFLTTTEIHDELTYDIEAHNYDT